MRTLKSSFKIASMTPAALPVMAGRAAAPVVTAVMAPVAVTVRIAGAVLTGLVVLAAAPAFAQTQEQPPAADVECARLQARIDSLEVKLEKVIMDNVDASPFATGETLDWGTGWNTSALTAAENQWTIELGYMFGFRGWTPPWEVDYIDHRRSYRLGVSAGFEYYRREGLLAKDNGDLYYSQGSVVALKLTWGTPVLLNFISGSAYLRGLWIFPLYDDGDTGREKSLAGVGLGSDLEFWIARDKCLTVGFKLEGDWDSWVDEGKYGTDQVLPYRFRPQMGVRVFF
jgi:hypothetical protein